MCARKRTYTVSSSPAAARQLKKLRKNQTVLASIAATIRKLADEPRPPGAEQLGPNWYRVRDGEYRIVYVVDDSAGTVIIAKVADRKDVYRH